MIILKYLKYLPSINGSFWLPLPDPLDTLPWLPLTWLPLLGLFEFPRFLLLTLLGLPWFPLAPLERPNINIFIIKTISLLSLSLNIIEDLIPLLYRSRRSLVSRVDVRLRLCSSTKKCNWIYI
jgi:hypothetical protein